VTLRTPSMPGKDFSGEVTITNLTADEATKKFRVETVFDNPGLDLRPGTFGDVMIEVKSHEGVLAVPQRAILDNRYVYVVRDGRSVKRDVTLGLQSSDWVEILSGLEEGEPVIVDGNFGLEEGASVRIEGEVRR
jgi:RND family efflux transporter MFP subunit